MTVTFPEWLMLKIDRAYTAWSGAMWRRVELWKLGAVENIETRVYRVERAE